MRTLHTCMVHVVRMGMGCAVPVHGQDELEPVPCGAWAVHHGQARYAMRCTMRGKALCMCTMGRLSTEQVHHGYGLA